MRKKTPNWQTILHNINYDGLMKALDSFVFPSSWNDPLSAHKGSQRDSQRTGAVLV